MTKKHNTFPGEQEEMAKPKQPSEVNQPVDPSKPEIPAENPGLTPDEDQEIDYPPKKDNKQQ